MTNKLKDARVRAGLSQPELARLVDTSVVEIYRVESGADKAGIHMARAIAAALGVKVHELFPGAEKVLKVLDAEVREDAPLSKTTLTKLREVGLEGDSRLYTLKVLLRGHQAPMFFQFAASDFDRLFRAVQDENSDKSELSFIMFDSDRLSVAINLRAIVFCHFLWDAAFGASTQTVNADDEGEEHRHQSVHVYFSGSTEPEILGVAAEDGRDMENEDNYLNSIFYRLDSGGLEAHERLHVVDEDGESAFLRAGDISLLTAPRWVLDKGELDALEDDDEGED